MKNSEVERLLKTERYTVDDLCAIMRLLRAPDGCPWDREQTHESVRDNLIEETYEAVEAIDTRNSQLLCEELGDLLMQVIFHSRMSEEEGSFDFSDVVHGVSAKLVRRHPHVFGDVTAETADAVLTTWDAVKSTEKQERKTAADKMRAVPPSLPALMRAQKLASRAKKEGGYHVMEDMLSSLLKQTADALFATESPVEKKRLTGVLLFLSSECARLSDVSPEEALTLFLNDFVASFDKWETAKSSSDDKSDNFTPNLW